MCGDYQQKGKDVYNRGTVEWIYQAVLKRRLKVQSYKQINNKCWEIKEIGSNAIIGNLRIYSYIKTGNLKEYKKALDEDYSRTNWNE